MSKSMSLIKVKTEFHSWLKKHRAQINELDKPLGQMIQEQFGFSDGLPIYKKPRKD